VNPYVVIVGVVLFLSAVGTAGWKGYAMGADHEIASRAKDESVEKRTRDAALSAAAEAIAGIQVRHTTIRQPVEREIRENVVYRDCHHSPDAFGLLNHALEDSAPGDASTSDIKLPAADSSR
jgi:hypothetical protein